MTTETKPKTVHVNNGSMAGAFWTAGWMFTIAFAKLIWWKALLGLIVWPWYLALAVR
jgi:acyl-coenzyme A synthetase/AMP-(fatty) acid ligase